MDSVVTEIPERLVEWILLLIESPKLARVGHAVRGNSDPQRQTGKHTVSSLGYLVLLPPPSHAHTLK